MEHTGITGEEGSETSDARSMQRLSDRITTLFYEACRTESLDAARHLMLALECEVARSMRSSVVDKREDGHDLAAVRARLALELRKTIVDVESRR